MTTSVGLEGRLFIDGEFQESESGRRYDVINPADESVIATAADADPADVTRDVDAAVKATETTDWATNHEFRRACLKDLQQGLKDATEEIKQIQVSEAGICYSTTVTHVDAMIDDMSYFNGLIASWPWESDLPPYELLGMRSNRRIPHEPYGVVGAITPWNAPFMTNIWKIGHALATGNAVVLKSAP